MWPKTAMCRYFFPLQTANVAYFFKGKSNYPDFLHVRTARHPKLSWISGVLLHFMWLKMLLYVKNAQIENIFLGHVAV